MTGSGQCQRVDVEHDIEVEETVHVGNKTYRLRSVVYHTGTADFGHYFCVCRYSNDGNQWWFYNNTTRMEVCSLATAKTKASISALVRAYLCIYESSEGNDFAAESRSHGGIGAEKQNAEQGPGPSAGTSSEENTSKPQRESKIVKCGNQGDSHDQEQEKSRKGAAQPKTVVECRKCAAVLPSITQTGRIRCSQCSTQWTLQDGDYVKEWCVWHDDCKPVREHSFGVSRTWPLSTRLTCKKCSVKFSPSEHAKRTAWQEYKHVLDALPGHKR